MRLITPTTFLAATALLAAPAMARQQYDCVIEPFMVLKIGAAVEGVVETINMTRGAVVRHGDVLAVLESNVERATIELAEAQLRSTVSLDVAQSRIDLAQTERDRAAQLVERNAGTQANLDVAKAELRAAKLRLIEAQENKVLQRFERDRAAALLKRRTVRSPIDGVLLRRLIGPGEYVYSQAHVAQIATIDPLYVDVFLPSELYSAIEMDQTATVRPAAPINGTFTARVSAIDQVFDAASDTFGVRLEMPNPDNALPAGVDCTIEFTGG